MKPFCLEKALAGEPVVTRSGIPVTEITQFSTGEILAVVNKELHRFTTKGHFPKWDSSEHKWNLCMAPVKKQEWANVYKSPLSPGYSFGAGLFSSEDEAKFSKYGGEYVATVLIREWEE